MTTDEWQERLEDTFTVKGVVGGHLSEVNRRESDLGNYLIQTFRGQNVMIDSFQSFFIETLDLVLDEIGVSGWPDFKHYSLTLAHFNTLFRRYRAGEILYYSGYPLDGYVLLRDIKDRALLTCGVLHGMTSIPRIMGLIPPMPDTPDGRRKATQARRKEEGRVTRLVSGKDSGLPIDVIDELKVWDDLFHLEVHGAALSLSHELKMLSKGMANRVGPTFYQPAFTMYMNRSVELGWLILRLLPYLQIKDGAFDEQWHHKHAVLDASFRYMVQGLSNLGKRIGSAFIALVDEKFSFSADLKYFDPEIAM